MCMYICMMYIMLIMCNTILCMYVYIYIYIYIYICDSSLIHPRGLGGCADSSRIQSKGTPASRVGAALHYLYDIYIYIYTYVNYM